MYLDFNTQFARFYAFVYHGSVQLPTAIPATLAARMVTHPDAANRDRALLKSNVSSGA